MKTLKSVAMSFFIGVVLSVVPIFGMAAACDPRIAINVGLAFGGGQICELNGQSCGQNVCVCSYICTVLDPR